LSIKWFTQRSPAPLCQSIGAVPTRPTSVSIAAETRDIWDADWLAAQVTAFGEPVDLVGHDWGALLTIRLATAYDVPLRSWVADVAACFDSRYRWHRRAVEWQTPGVGERVVAAWLAADAAIQRASQASCARTPPRLGRCDLRTDLRTRPGRHSHRRPFIDPGMSRDVADLLAPASPSCPACTTLG
jgi:pimeloyl-ACP methyl ester carboxylesterase